MKNTVLRTILFAAFILVAQQSLHAEDFTPLPFGVKLGGQDAKAEKGKTFATIADPVANDADLEVDIKDAKMVIVNFFPADEKGEVKPGATAAILILQGKNKGPINKTMTNKALDAGTYRANIVGDGKTAIIVFKVK
jgi:hypothetical protein